MPPLLLLLLLPVFFDIFQIKMNHFRLQFSDGVMRIQTPKKRRKLYSGRRDYIEDFNDVDDGDNDIQNSIKSILNILEDDKVRIKS